MESIKIKMVKSRKFKWRGCYCCRKDISVNENYYQEKTYYSGKHEDGKPYFFVNKQNYCVKCYWYKTRHDERYDRFIQKERCKHPVIDTHYGYIPGEAVKEPKYDYCLICGKIV